MGKSKPATLMNMLTQHDLRKSRGGAVARLRALGSGRPEVDSGSYKPLAMWF